MYRQGDLLFVECDSVPEDSKLQEDGIIARGEVTGHMHRISDSSKALLMLCGAVAYIKAIHEAEVVHDEHDTIVLPPGKYEVVRQREYRPDGWVQVSD